MAPKRSIKIHCPTCKTSVKKSAPDFPFCSERCRLIDLGKWASGAYVVSSPIRDTSEALEEAGGDDSEHK
jgi:endogenous inhibitor of DNA gyrase (YacG/DUF329 family)